MKIGIIGSLETVMGFKALGLEPLLATTADQALDHIKSCKQLKDDERFAILFITEDLRILIPHDDYVKATSAMLPAVIVIPSHKGSTGFGLENMRRAVERAVGSDILS